MKTHFSVHLFDFFSEYVHVVKQESVFLVCLGEDGHACSIPGNCPPVRAEKQLHATASVHICLPSFLFCSRDYITSIYSQGFHIFFFFICAASVLQGCSLNQPVSKINTINKHN